jgi:phosphoglycerate kinase
MAKLQLNDLALDEQKVLVRVDYNVPLDEKGVIIDDTRIKASLPTIEYLLKHKATVILVSHLGKPKGKSDKKLSLEPVAKHLQKLLKEAVYFLPDCRGKEVKDFIDKLKGPSVVLLENVRFHEAEEDPKKDPSFAKELASLGQFFVNDAFGTAHRSHSSTVEVAKYFPKKATCGFLMQKEIEFLGDALKDPKRPFYAIIGGSKVSSKLGVLKALLNKVDALFIGGGMSYTFLKALGYNVGSSLVEADLLPVALQIIEEAKTKKIALHLPIDLLIADAFKQEANYKEVSIEEGIEDGFQGMGIGIKTVAKWSKELVKAHTVFWNGPVGVYEFKNSAKSTEDIAKALSQLDAITIIGGGDSVAAINSLGLESKFSHLSTGGGAALEFIEFGSLVGVDALADK